MKKRKLISIGLCLIAIQTNISAQSAKLTLQLDKPIHDISPTLYGSMTEEINYSYDGDLYAGTVRNCTFQDDTRQPVHWSLFEENNSLSALCKTSSLHTYILSPRGDIKIAKRQ